MDLIATELTSLRIETLPPRGRVAHARHLADLLVRDYRAWPYLRAVDGKAALQTMRSLCMDPGVLIVAGLVGDRIVGASIIQPLTPLAIDRYGDWLARHGRSPQRWGLGSYVLIDPTYRSLRVAAAIGRLIDEAARAAGMDGWVNMILERPADDPRASEGYRPPLGYFLKRGYERVDVPSITVSWRDVGDDRETAKQFIAVAKEVGHAAA